MARVSDVEIFVQVVDAGGFTAAADALGLSKSYVSKRIRALEDHLGTSLLTRNTRNVAPTPAGERYHARCSAALELLEDAEREATQEQREPRGTLKVSLPLTFGVRHVVPRAAPLSVPVAWPVGRQQPHRPSRESRGRRLRPRHPRGPPRRQRADGAQARALRSVGRGVSRLPRAPWRPPHARRPPRSTTGSPTRCRPTPGSGRCPPPTAADPSPCRSRVGWCRTAARPSSRPAWRGSASGSFPTGWSWTRSRGASWCACSPTCPQARFGVWAIYPKHRHMSPKVSRFVDHLAEAFLSAPWVQRGA